MEHSPLVRLLRPRHLTHTTNPPERLQARPFAGPFLFRPHPHEGLAVTFRDKGAVLLEGLVVEFDDPGAGARLRLSLAHHLRRAVDGVAFKERIGKLHIGHAEIGDRSTDRHIRDLDADHETEGEQGIHERLAPFGFGFAEVPVDMERLRIERHVREQHVVHLCDRARVAVLVGLADLEVLEIEAAALMTLDRSNHRYPPKSFVVGRLVGRLSDPLIIRLP